MWYVGLIGTLSPDFMGKRDVLVLTCISVVIRNKNFAVLLFDLSPGYSALCLTPRSLFCKVCVPFPVKVFPPEPTGLGLYPGSPELFVQPHSWVVCTSFVCPFPVLYPGLVCVTSPPLSGLGVTG